MEKKMDQPHRWDFEPKNACEVTAIISLEILKEELVTSNSEKELVILLITSNTMSD